MNNNDTSAADATQPGSNPFLDYAIQCGYDPRKKIKKNERHIVLGQAVVSHIRASGEEMINTPSGAWFYSQGVWSRVNKKCLAVRIEMACRALDFASDTKLINETRNWMFRQPGLWRDRVPPQERKPSGAR
jgi:hypothetical protein